MRKRKNILITILLFFFVIFFVTNVYADTESDLNDPENPAFRIQKEEEVIPFSSIEPPASYMSPYTGKTYIHGSGKENYRAAYGIDVSKWQGDIDWKKVRKSGIEFAFIRCGYSVKSGKFAAYEDPYFKKNIVEANKAGIKTGIYYFSSAKTKTEAEKEALKTLNIIKDYKNLITLPVVYDFEAFTPEYRAYKITKSAATENAKLYLDMIKQAGYIPAYYGCPDIFERYYDMKKLSGYICWLANYTTKTKYTGTYDYWQYSETGKVDGINGYVDCNFYYDTNNRDGYYGSVKNITMAKNTMSSITLRWSRVQDADGYRIYRSKVLNGNFKKIKTIIGNQNTSYKDCGVIKSEGRQYYYKVVPYKISKENIMQYGKESKTLTAYTKREHSFYLKTKAPVNLRSHAGVEYNTLISVPKGKKITFYKYAIASDGKRWYKITYKKNGKSYTGYLHQDYIKIYKR